MKLPLLSANSTLRTSWLSYFDILSKKSTILMGGKYTKGPIREKTLEWIVTMP